MTTCVVTGGAGFVGSHLCEHLLEKGYSVVCVDNLDTGSLQNIEHIRSDRFRFTNHDITEEVHVEGDEARSTSHLQAIDTSSRATLATGFVRAEHVRTAAGWRIRRYAVEESITAADMAAIKAAFHTDG